MSGKLCGASLVFAVLARVFAFEPLIFAQTSPGPAQPLIMQSINEGHLIMLADKTRADAKNPGNDRGIVPDNLPMPHMTLQLRRPAAQEQAQALQMLTVPLHDPHSPKLHHWVSASEIGAQFGPASSDIQSISSWLQRHGFTVNRVHANRIVIDYSGAAAQVRAEFHADIHYLDVSGVIRFANMSDPEIPAALLSAGASSEALVHCFNTNGIVICHDPRDESVFYNTPKNEVAYNVQTIHDDGNYYTIYHSEPKGKYRNGDAIKAGVSHGTYTFNMPPHRYRLWGSDDDPQSLLDSDGIGGAANPIAIAGRPGDSYFYVFFLGVSDDDRSRNQAVADWRHYLLEARTKDFISFELKAEDGWMPFAENVRPAPAKDMQGNIIRSNTGRAIDQTQGLIGSISFVNGAYHYFYLDYAPDGGSINLYHRVSTDVSTGVWSPQEAVFKMSSFVMIRVAKAKNLDRWVVMYGCYVGTIQDICLQYTKSLDVIGPGGISELHLTSESALGFSRDGKAKSFTQPFWLTDRWGNLDVVGSDNGGEMYWTDMTPSNCLVLPYLYCPVYGGAVLRAGWTTSAP